MAQSTVEKTTTVQQTAVVSKPCRLTNENRTGAIGSVQPSVRGETVDVWIQWNASVNATELDVMLDDERLFRTNPYELVGPTVSGWGQEVGTAPLSSDLRIELSVNDSQVGQYRAEMGCE
ncbi:hypothetical protein [Haladaptatus cibarius]|uniref:hypothetical protein n=1 Tax=Haladaptatus cibarius TaxID=453847 RepID=UPI000A80186E|nr:hypothetical protein [Haladaptatus cibarius]